MRAQKLELMQKQRLAAHVHERLGQAVEHGGEPRALSSGENDRLLHGGFSWRLISPIARRTASSELSFGVQPSAESFAVE